MSRTPHEEGEGSLYRSIKATVAGDEMIGGTTMDPTKAVVTFRVAVTSKASPEAIYDVLSDPNTHLTWAGEQAPMKSFRLLSMDAPAEAVVGTEFSSSGANSSNGKSTFFDKSVVVEADRATRFGFDTESRLTRPHSKEWHARFSHRYTIEPSADGATIRYVAEVRPQNYTPPWLIPGARSFTRVLVQYMHRKHMLNLVKMAEARTRTPSA